MILKRSYSSAIVLKKASLRTFEEYIKFPCIFWERWSFISRIKNNIIFLGKRNFIFSDDTRKIIFQCNIFEKTISLEHLEKENIVYQAVYWTKEGTNKVYNNIMKSIQIQCKNGTILINSKIVHFLIPIE